MIGIHVKSNDKNDIKESLKYLHEIKCTHVQIFNEKIDDYNSMRELLNKNNLKLVIHAPYIINLASQYNRHGWKMKYLLTELELGMQMGAIGYVIHLGSGNNQTIINAYNNMYQTLRHISSYFDGKPLKIYLETTSGQGSELCYKLEDLADFYYKIKHDHKFNFVKLCLDTCHVFAAGYDIRSEEKAKNFLKYFDNLIGLGNIGLIHLNDSMNDIGTRKDRHAGIGEGFIGESGLKYMYKYFSSNNIPCIIEAHIPETTIDILDVVL